MVDQNWQVNVAFTEDGDRTRADATLELAGQHYHGMGPGEASTRGPERARDRTRPRSGESAVGPLRRAAGRGRRADREGRGPHRQGARLTSRGGRCEPSAPTARSRRGQPLATWAMRSGTEYGRVSGVLGDMFTRTLLLTALAAALAAGVTDATSNTIMFGVRAVGSR